MPSNFTANYQLSQWKKTDQVKMDDFNEDNRKIDAALKAEADARTALASSRNCQAYTTSYTGSGVSGASHPNYLSFARRPLFFHIGGNNGTGFSVVYGQTTARVTGVTSLRKVYLTWSGNSVSWYEDNTGYKESPDHQMNESGVQYKVFALLGV